LPQVGAIGSDSHNGDGRSGVPEEHIRSPSGENKGKISRWID
jgi:hypothetical protein